MVDLRKYRGQIYRFEHDGYIFYLNTLQFNDLKHQIKEIEKTKKILGE